MTSKSGTLKPSLRKAARAVNPIVEGGRKHLGGERPEEAWDEVKREYCSPEELERRTVARKAGHPHVFGELHEHSSRNTAAGNTPIADQEGGKAADPRQARSPRQTDTASPEGSRPAANSSRAEKPDSGPEKRLAAGPRQGFESEQNNTASPEGLRPAAKSSRAEKPDSGPGKRLAAGPRQGFESEQDNTDAAGDTLCMIDVDRVVESPDNPREEFDPVLLQELADGIKRTNGVLQPILVLPLFGGTWELVDGARRLRATKLAGFEQIAASVRAMTAKEAALARLEANARRQDINPLEKAKAIQRAIDKQGATQAEIGAALGIQQSTVSNHLRVLRLPEEWHGLIAAGTVSESHAKLVVPYVECPTIMEELVSMAKEGLTVSGFESRMSSVLDRCTRRMTKSSWGSGPQFKMTPAVEKELRPIKVKLWDKSELRATNVELWDRLQEEAEQAKSAKDLKRAAAAAENGRTPEAEEKLREQQARTRAKQLYRYKILWLQEHCVAALDEAEDWLVTCLLLQWACDGDGAHQRLSAVEESLRNRRVNYAYTTRTNLFAGLLAAGNTPTADEEGGKAAHPRQARSPRHTDTVLKKLLAQWLKQSPEGMHTGTPAYLVESVAEALSVDFLREWKPDREFLQLHTKEQLLALAKAWKLTVDPARKRMDMLDDLVVSTAAARSRLAMPEELRKVKAVDLW